MSKRYQKTIDGQAYMLEIIDTAGQDEYNSMRDRYIRLGEGDLVGHHGHSN